MPDSFALAVVDVSGIQDYVFRTNNLQHHLGASELVRRATGEWVTELVPEPHNAGQFGELKNAVRIEDPLTRSEVLYLGGGNAVIVFADGADARRFIRALSQRVLLQAPGLTITIALRAFDWQRQSIAALISDMLSIDIQEQKQRGAPSGEMLGLGVTADCEFTGMPAVAHDPRDHKRISAEVEAKLEMVQFANERLSREVGGADYVFDFDQIGTKGESSYLAVVHADGNGIGRRFDALARQFKEPPADAGAFNRQYIIAVRELSRAVNSAGRGALRDTATSLRDAWREKGKIGGVIPTREGRLPFRPIVFGGDDVTFVCDARLGLGLAARYLEAFGKAALPAGHGPLTARAGIAITNTHYPFAQTYRLASALEGTAKARTEEGTLAAMDWHIAVNGLVLDLKDARDRDYHADDGANLLMRPLQLDPPAAEWRSWEGFAQIAHALGNAAVYPANKVKAFREALRQGRAAAQRFISSNFDAKKAPLPPISSRTTNNGWVGDYCAYFDAVEAMEFFVPIEPRKRGANR